MIESEKLRPSINSEFGIRNAECGMRNYLCVTMVYHNDNSFAEYEEL